MPEIQQEVIYFLMAKIFGMVPSLVDRMPYEQVINLLNLDAEWRKKEQEDSKK